MEKYFKYYSNSEETRICDYQKISTKHPLKVPIIIDSHCFEIKKTKFLMEYDQTIVHLLLTFRKLHEIQPSEAIFVFAYPDEKSPIIVNGGQMIGEIRDLYKHKDGFLYLCVQKENTFG